MPDNTFYLAINDDGDMAGDMNRKSAINRLVNEFGGDCIRVIALAVTVPAMRDMTASLSLPYLPPAQPVVTATEE